MKRSTTLILCSSVLAAGFVIGMTADGWLQPSHVRASALSFSDADRLFAELDSDTGSLMESSRLLTKIAKVATPSVVHIQSEYRSPRGSMVEETGSGVIMTSPKSSDTFVVTNRHVIANAKLKDIAIHIFDGRLIHPTHVLKDSATDVAVLKIDATNLHPARWSNSDKLEIGHMVLAMGSPFGLSQSVTFGIVSAKGRRSLKLGKETTVLNQDFLQTDAAINPGNSGGPLIDLHGRVVGINTAIASNSGGNDGIGFSIPSNLVRRVVDQLLEHGRVQRAYLGVKLDPSFEADEARRLQLDRVRGARIVEVYSKTPASKANLKFDDVVLEFNGTKVEDENHLINLVSLTAVGRKVTLSVFRNGKKMDVEVLLTDRDDLNRQSAVPSSSHPGVGVPVQTMGLTVHPVDDSISDQLGFNETAKGLLVLNVDSLGPLGRHVQLYDIIEEVSRTEVSSVNDLQQALSTSESGDSVVLKVRTHRNGVQSTHLVIWQR
ncbi:MAG: PDZ domain-containing protein [Planctomycetaceae bacterium]|jgi:serine protease Do|nr:PDZ domain-containing protein [Planctomycetaceae bacterium]MBT6153513.1 PDZ domain-containing protein [Planctomycetaceae bacterium]MBT6497356.1 PDZ domain-containing protein [Planctomycetaceae bacterium]